MYYAPNTFDLDELGVAVVTDANGDPEEAVRTAVMGCPTHAITVE
jgi:ferredoxin